MLKWLSEKSRHIKKVMFAVVGVSVAANIATALVFPLVSWISNLLAIVGGSSYSIFKNMEVARRIKDRQKEVCLIADRMSLKRYQSPERLEQILGHVKGDPRAADALVIAINQTMSDFNRNISISTRHVILNATTQMLLCIAILVVNIIANVETPEKRQDAMSVKNILNLVMVPICVVTQYLLHMLLAARNLREQDEKVTQLRSEIVQAQKDLRFQWLEASAFFQRRDSVKSRMRKLEAKIENYKSQLIRIAATIEAMHDRGQGTSNEEEHSASESGLDDLLRIRKKLRGKLKSRQNELAVLSDEEQGLTKDEYEFSRTQETIRDFAKELQGHTDDAEVARASSLFGGRP